MHLLRSASIHQLNAIGVGVGGGAMYFFKGVNWHRTFILFTHHICIKTAPTHPLRTWHMYKRDMVLRGGSAVAGGRTGGVPSSPPARASLLSPDGFWSLWSFWSKPSYCISVVHWGGWPGWSGGTIPPPPPARLHTGYIGNSIHSQ